MHCKIKRVKEVNTFFKSVSSILNYCYKPDIFFYVFHRKYRHKKRN